MNVIATNKPFSNSQKSLPEGIFAPLILFEVEQDTEETVFSSRININPRSEIQGVLGTDNIWQDISSSIPPNSADFLGKTIKGYIEKNQNIFYMAFDMFLSINFKAQFQPLLNLQNLILSDVKTINSLENISWLYPNLTRLVIRGAFNDSIDVAVFKDLKLNWFEVLDSNATGELVIENLQNASILSFSGSNFSITELDNLVQKLYEAGDFFVSRGKSLNISNQQSNAKVSGTLGDPVSAGTGQGYITGLIDEFGWTVTQ